MIPVFVDMDGTLIKGSTSSLEIRSFLKENGPFRLGYSIITNQLFSRLKLKTWLSNQEFEQVQYEFDQEIVEVLKKLQRKGTKLTLATASPSSSTKRVMNQSPIVFQELISSDEVTNLKGSKKLEAIKSSLYNNNAFDFFYIGDSYVDLKIMKHSKSSLFVGGKIPFLFGKYLYRIKKFQNLKTFNIEMWV